MMLFNHWNVTCQCGTEDDVIHSLECDQVSVELKMMLFIHWNVTRSVWN